MHFSQTNDILFTANPLFAVDEQRSLYSINPHREFTEQFLMQLMAALASLSHLYFEKNFHFN